MGKGTADLAPWEVPPDEAYWRALLQEGQYGPEPARDPDTFNQDSSLSQPDTQAESTEPSPWDLAQQYCQENRSVILEVIGYNRGGLLVDWNGLIGFVPASHLCDHIASQDMHARQQALSAYVGQSCELQVIEAKAEQNRLILSERTALRVQEPDAGILDELTGGSVCRGRVTNLCAFGVFVDLGGIEGLIHISELSWGRVSHPSDVLQPGDNVKVYVLNVDRQRKRVALSLKRLYPDPWDTVDARYRVGQVVQGTITNVVNFGAFVRLETGLEGLIHSSDWNDPTPLDPSRKESVVRVRIVTVDPERRRMGLRLETLVDGEGD